MMVVVVVIVVMDGRSRSGSSSSGGGSRGSSGNAGDGDWRSKNMGARRKGGELAWVQGGHVLRRHIP